MGKGRKAMSTIGQTLVSSLGEDWMWRQPLLPGQLCMRSNIGPGLCEFNQGGNVENRGNGPRASANASGSGFVRVASTWNGGAHDSRGVSMPAGMRVVRMKD